MPVPNAVLGTPGTATLTILGPTTLTFGDDFYDVTELGGSRTVTILRAGNLGVLATVQYATSDGTATAGADYTAVSGTATFLPGQTTVTFAVPIIPHVMLEPTQTIGLALGNASSGAVLGAPSTAVIEITDVPAAMIQFSGAGFSALDTDGVATITVTRTGNLALESRVDFRTRDGRARASAGDYVPVSGALTFPSSTGPAQMLTFTVTLAGRTGTVNLALANVSSHTVLGTRDAVLSIDAAPPAPAAGVTILYAGRGFDVTVPAINDTGQFPYSLSQAGVTTIFSGDLARPLAQRTAAVVPDALTAFFTGDTTPVDSSERVVFETKLPAGNTEGLALASNTSGSRVILQTSATVSAVFEPVMSTNGTIAVAARVLAGGTGNFETGVLRADAAGNFVVIASRGTPTDAGALTSIVSTVAVNNAGTVAFYSNTQAKSGIFTADGTTVTTVASTAGDFSAFRGRVSINDAGAVAFIGIPRGGRRTVYVADAGGSLTQFAVEGQPGGFTDLVSGTAPLISNGGAVAFTAFFAGGHGIFTGPDLVMDKVITTGDTLGGRVVTRLTLGRINNARQISFRAQLDDGSFAAAVFTPAP